MKTLESLAFLTALSGTALASEPSVVTAVMPKEASVEARAQIALSLQTPSCNDPSVNSLPSGRYVSENNVIAYASAAEASNPATWTYELTVMVKLLELFAQGKEYELGSTAYTTIDPKDVSRFLEPGSAFVLTEDRELQARRATVNGRSVWLSDALPASCFGTTIPDEESLESAKICFVPLTTDTAR